MLYSEFLIGTGKTEGEWTLSEYERINAIYNNDNTLTKEDAYKMYIEKPQYVADLEKQNELLFTKMSTYKKDYYDADGKLFEAVKENERLQARVEYLERIIYSAYHDMNK